MRPLLLSLGVLALTFACTPSDDGGDAAGTETATETSAGETSSDTTTDTGSQCMPPGVFGNCIDGGAAACQAEGSTICPTDNLDNPSLGVCAKRCDDVCECWAAPATGNAAVECIALVDGDPKKTCVLDCSGGETCPDGMQCLDTLSICVWPTSG